VNEVQSNYRRILERISAVALNTGRDPGDIRLVVVTKGQPVEKIRAVIEAGARDLGENYLEEAIPKIELFSENEGLIWHMIGHVQSRKASGVSQYFGYIQSLDSLKLARRMSQALESGKAGKPVLLEFNASGEEAKYGLPAWQEERWSELIPELREIVMKPNLAIRGLMGMAPYARDPESARPYFQRLFKLREYLKYHIPERDWNELSMGMSTDFEIAIQEGATILRLGEAIMGKRN
jgi:pyridoxal phosphate enzyme (YggS family)